MKILSSQYTLPRQLLTFLLLTLSPSIPYTLIKKTSLLYVLAFCSFLTFTPLFANSSPNLISWDSLTALYYKHQNPTAAHHHLEERLKHYPLETQSLLLLARLNLQGSPIEDILLSIPTDSQTTHQGAPLIQLGEWYFAAGQFSKAIYYWSDLYKRLPQSPLAAQALYQWGSTLVLMHREGLADSAESIFTELLKLQKPSGPFYSLALEGIAKSRLAQKEPSSAKDALLKALETAAPQQIPGLYLLLYQASRMSKDLSGRDYYKNILKTQYPQSPEYRSLTTAAPQIQNESPPQNKTLSDSTTQALTPGTLVNPVENPYQGANTTNVRTDSLYSNKADTLSSSRLQVQNGSLSSGQSGLSNQSIQSSPKTRVQASASPHQTTRFAVQLGSFQNRENASRRLSELKFMGIPLNPQPEASANGQKWLILSPSFTQRRAAEDYLEKYIVPKQLPHYIIELN